MVIYTYSSSSQNRNSQKPLRHLNSVCSDLGIMLLKNSFSHELACWVKNDQREMVMLVSEMALTEQVLAALCWAAM